MAATLRKLGAISARTPRPVKFVVKPIWNFFFGIPEDQASKWMLEKPTDPSEPYLDVIRFGSCDYRATEHAHTMEAPVGWPKNMGESMEARGVKLAFQNIFVWHFEDFPTLEQLIKYRKDRGAPDVIVIQTGGMSTMAHLWGFNLFSFALRENIGRRLGRLMTPIWRFIIAPTLLRIGRPAPYYGPQKQLAAFVEMVSEHWPGVPIEHWDQTPPVYPGFWKLAVSERLHEEALAIYAEIPQRVEFIEDVDIPPGMEYRGANSLNFNLKGSAIAGEKWAEYLLEKHGSAVRSGTERAAQGQLGSVPNELPAADDQRPG